MKKLILFSIIALMACACTDIKQVGRVNMISTRNIDHSADYKLLSTYSGGTQREKLNSKCVSVQDAVDETVKRVPGGEYIMNAKIYLVNGQYWAVEGDVYGLNTTINYRGIGANDKVTWKYNEMMQTGTVIALKDDKTCYVKPDAGGSNIEIKYELLTKVDASLINTIPKVGDEVSYQGVFGGIRTGKVLAINNGMAKIECSDNGKTSTVNRKLYQLTVVK